MAFDTGSDSTLVKEIGMPIYQARGWMKFLGVLSVIYGVLVALTIVGLVIAWLPIWVGVLLFQSANAIEEAVQIGQKQALTRSLGKLKIYFIIMGVIALTGLVLAVLGFFGGMMGAMRGFHGPFV